MYITLSAKKYIKKKAKEQGALITKESFDILSTYSSLAKKKGYRLLFCRMLAYGKDDEVCNANFKYMPIHVSQAYAAKLVLDNSKDIQNAFLMSLGHEMTHKDNDVSFLKGLFVKNGVKFIAYVNEVHADFGATQKLANNSRQKQLEAIKSKMKYKKNIENPDQTHPSWKKRYDYIQKSDFNENLIRQIAQDTNCINENLIQELVNHFEKIQLI